MLWTLLLGTLGWNAHPLEWVRLGEFEGRSIAQVKVIDFARSEVIEDHQVVEMTLQGAHRWQVRCLKQAAGTKRRMACRIESPGQPVLRLSLADEGGRDWIGAARTSQPLTIVASAPTIMDTANVPADQDGLPVATARLTDADGRVLARLESGLPPRMEIRDDVTAQQREHCAALILTLNIAGYRWSTQAPLTVYDGYLIGAGTTPTNWSGASVSHAAAVNDPHLLSGGPRLDLNAGTRLDREGDFGRVVIGLELGGQSTSSDAGDTRQFSIDMMGGLRLAARTHVGFVLGLQVGTAQGPDAGVDLGAFGLGLHARHAFSLGIIEPVVGARVRGRFRFGEILGADPDMSGSAAQLGVSLAPTVGLQWPYSMNRHDTRIVIFAEAAPEWSYWTTPSLDDLPPDPAQVLRAQLQTRDWAVNAILGVRFEL